MVSRPKRVRDMRGRIIRFWAVASCLGSIYSCVCWGDFDHGITLHLKGYGVVRCEVLEVQEDKVRVRHSGVNFSYTRDQVDRAEGGYASEVLQGARQILAEAERVGADGLPALLGELEARQKEVRSVVDELRWLVPQGPQALQDLSAKIPEVQQSVESAGKIRQTETKLRRSSEGLAPLPPTWQGQIESATQRARQIPLAGVRDDLLGRLEKLKHDLELAQVRSTTVFFRRFREVVEFEREHISGVKDPVPLAELAALSKEIENPQLRAEAETLMTSLKRRLEKEAERQRIEATLVRLETDLSRVEAAIPQLFSSTEATEIGQVIQECERTLSSLPAGFSIDTQEKKLREMKENLADRVAYLEGGKATATNGQAGGLRLPSSISKIGSDWKPIVAIGVGILLVLGVTLPRGKKRRSGAALASLSPPPEMQPANRVSAGSLSDPLSRSRPHVPKPPPPERDVEKPASAADTSYLFLGSGNVPGEEVSPLPPTPPETSVPTDFPGGEGLPDEEQIIDIGEVLAAEISQQIAEPSPDESVLELGSLAEMAGTSSEVPDALGASSVEGPAGEFSFAVESVKPDETPTVSESETGDRMEDSEREEGIRLEEEEPPEEHFSSLSEMLGLGGSTYAEEPLDEAILAPSPVEMEPQEEAEAETATPEAAEVGMDEAAQVCPITGLHTREWFETQFEKAIEEARHLRSTVALFFIEPDGIEKLGQEELEDYKEDILSIIGTTLRRTTRGSDLLAHYSDWRFAVGISPTTTTRALPVGLRIREQIQKKIATSLENSPLQSTSLGLSCMDARSEEVTLEELAKRAQYALEDAKANGGNRVILAGFEGS